MKRHERNSSIELLKVIGIVLIVISHVTQTLIDNNNYIPYDDYLVTLSTAASGVQYLLLIMLRYSGTIGNTIFFICSCWFLLDSEKSNKKKMLQMLLDIWFISVVILAITFILRGGDINTKFILQSFLPTTYNNNWYMTCYLLFYAIHPILNNIIKPMEQKKLLRCTLVLLFLYVICNFILHTAFFTSDLILWTTIYFSIAYMKLYLTDISNNKKLNFTILLIGIIGTYGLILFTYLLGFKITLSKDLLMRWDKRCNPFVLMMVIGIFNLVRNVEFKNKAINYISKLSLFIYIIHENLILASYYRPMIWQYVYTNFGYDYIFGWLFAIVILVFAFGFIASVIYQLTLQKLVILVTDKLYNKLINCYGLFERILLQLH